MSLQTVWPDRISCGRRYDECLGLKQCGSRFGNVEENRWPDGRPAAPLAEEGVVEADRKKFVAGTEEVLAGLHEGNFARYRLLPTEFDAWHALWHGK